MTGPDVETAALVQDIVRAVPGVTGIFPSGSTVSVLLSSGGRALGIVDATTPLVRVETGAEGTTVVVTIGIDAASPAVDVAQRVHEVIEMRLALLGLTPLQIHVTIAHIDDPSPTA